MAVCTVCVRFRRLLPSYVLAVPMAVRHVCVRCLSLLFGLASSVSLLTLVHCVCAAAVSFAERAWRSWVRARCYSAKNSDRFGQFA